MNWLVGILEGEGSFNTSLIPAISGNSYFKMRVAVGMTDVDIVRKVCSVVGKGKVYGPHTQGSYQPHWTWILQDSEAYRLMKLVLPLMGYRRSRKIEELLSVYERNKEEGIYNKREALRNRRKQ